MKTIWVVALDGMMASSLAITLDALEAAQQLWRRAGGPADPLRIRTVGPGARVRTGNGLQLSPATTFKKAVQSRIKPDWVIVPGLGLRSEQEIVSRLARRDAVEASGFLQRINHAGVRIGASCAGVFLLGAAGILEGRAATTTWWLAQAFRALYPAVRLDESRMVVRDGRFWTAGAAFSQLDLVLTVIADVLGSATAHLCARSLLIDQRPSQARYMIQMHLQQDDPTVVAAERWIDAHLSEAIVVSDLSSALAVSSRTLARRIEAATGASTIKFIQRRRLLRAGHLLETTSLSIDEISARVGYQNGTALRKLVKREFGMLPTALRRQGSPE